MSNKNDCCNVKRQTRKKLWKIYEATIVAFTRPLIWNKTTSPLLHHLPRVYPSMFSVSRAFMLSRRPFHYWFLCNIWFSYEVFLQQSITYPQNDWCWLKLRESNQQKSGFLLNIPSLLFPFYYKWLCYLSIQIVIEHENG